MPRYALLQHLEGPVINSTLNYLAAMVACTMSTVGASAQNARDVRGPSPLVAIENEAPAKLIVDPRLPNI